MHKERGDLGHAADLRSLAVGSRGSSGTVWTLEGSEDLNANLVRFPAGWGVEEHVNEDVDVVLVGVSGEGSVAVDGEEYEMRPGNLVFAPKGSRRSITSVSDDFAYLSVHRRRSGPRIGRKQ
jgi:quercetin dioxygenase-like cupin family protein